VEATDGIPRGRLVAAALLAVVAAVVGFWIAMRVAPPRAAEHRLTALDRRLAETGGDAGGPRHDDHLDELPPRRVLKYRSYVPPANATLRPRVARTAAPGTVVFAPAPTAAPKGKPPPGSPPRPTVAPRPSIMGAGTPRMATPSPPPTAAAPPAPATPPAVGWAAVLPALAIVERADRRLQLGVVLSAEGLLVTGFSALGRPDSIPVTLEDGAAQAKFLAADSHLDLAVLQLDRKPPAAARLASGKDVGAGSLLAYAISSTELSGDPSHLRVVSTVERDDVRVLHFNGLAPTTARGGPLVDEEGRVAGIVAGRGWDLPGASLGLAAAPESVATLLEDAAQPRRPPMPSERWLRDVGRDLVSDAVPRPPAERAETLTVIPGVRLGPYYIGDDLRRVVPPGTEPQPLGGGFMLFAPGGEGVGFVGLGGVVVAVLTNRGSYGTLNGAGVGMRFDQLDLGLLGPDLVESREPETGETAVVANGIELIGDADGRVIELHVLPEGIGR